MGSRIWKVAPLPTMDSTQIRPPASRDLLGDREPEAGTALGLGVGAVHLVELLEDADCSSPGMPGYPSRRR